MATINFDDANKILSKGYPDEKDLECFPCGEFLLRLWRRKDEDGEEYRIHGPKIMKAINDLLGGKPEDIMTTRATEEETKLLVDTQDEIGKDFSGTRRLDVNTQALFRIAALYHDIGKYIIKERHPTVGWYTMEYISSVQKDELRALVGGREDYLQLLMILIRDHDQFGVLCTGEASYPILLRAISSLGRNLDDQKRTVSAMMWLNLADMAASPGLKLQKDDLDKIVKDWKWIREALEVCAQDRRRLDDYIIAAAGSDELVEERICRLILEASRRVPRRTAELLDQSVGKERRITQLVRSRLQTVYPTDSPRRDFAWQLTHVCKLDYGKRFFNALVEYCEGEQLELSSEDASVRSKLKDPVDLDEVIYTVLAILRRITSTYSAMMRTDSGPGNLIGVEMKDLTPRIAPEKTARIIELLLKSSHYPGLSWMMSDVPAWYF